MLADLAKNGKSPKDPPLSGMAKRIEDVEKRKQPLTIRV